MLSLVRFDGWASGWKAEIIVSPTMAAHPAVKTISMGVTMSGRTPVGGGTIPGSSGKRRRCAVLSTS
jgi:hypothetical protein